MKIAGVTFNNCRVCEIEQNYHLSEHATMKYWAEAELNRRLIGEKKTIAAKDVKKI
jgi:hypothetical protein